VTLLWGLIPKKAISQFFQVRFHLKALKVLFPMLMNHVCVFMVLVIVMSRICVVLEQQVFLRNACCFSSNTCRYMQIPLRCTSKSCY